MTKLSTFLSLFLFMVLAPFMALATVAAGPERPAGWLGVYKAYGCHPDEWVDKGGYWNNPTCHAVGGGAAPDVEEPSDVGFGSIPKVDHPPSCKTVTC